MAPEISSTAIKWKREDCVEMSASRAPESSWGLSIHYGNIMSLQVYAALEAARLSQIRDKLGTKVTAHCTINYTLVFTGSPGVRLDVYEHCLAQGHGRIPKHLLYSYLKHAYRPATRFLCVLISCNYLLFFFILIYFSQLSNKTRTYIIFCTCFGGHNICCNRTPCHKSKLLVKMGISCRWSTDFAHWLISWKVCTITRSNCSTIRRDLSRRQIHWPD